jgi:hypothetical protein
MQQMNKPRPQPSGTATTDAAAPDGVAAQREISLADTSRAKKLGSDPYNSTSAEVAAAKRSLDDMRRLSDEIKTAPTWVPPRRALVSEQTLRLAGLRVELERVLTELERLTAGAIDPSDLQAGEQRRQIRDAARYLEDAIDRLMPP